MELLTEQELALVHSPELFEESYDYIYESEEEALYEDYLNTLNENFEIEALSNFLIENFETEEIDYIFALTEALQTYLVENFEFSNENEINEAILLLDEESVIEILEDFEYGEGITDATFEDILESVQSIYDSSDVIEESILGNFRDTVRGVIGLPPVDPKNIKSGKVYRGAKPGTSKKNEIIVRGAVGRRRSVTEDYEFLMEQAAVLSSLKVASMLAEVNLKQLAGAAGRIAGIGARELKKGYGRHLSAMEKLDAYNQRRRAARRGTISAAPKEPEAVKIVQRVPKNELKKTQPTAANIQYKKDYQERRIRSGAEDALKRVSKKRKPAQRVIDRKLNPERVSIGTAKRKKGGYSLNLSPLKNSGSRNPNPPMKRDRDYEEKLKGAEKAFEIAQRAAETTPTLRRGSKGQTVIRRKTKSGMSNFPIKTKKGLTKPVEKDFPNYPV